MTPSKSPPSTLLFDLSAAPSANAKQLFQKLIDDAPAPHREFLAYALYFAYLSIRFPGIPLSPHPTDLQPLDPADNPHISLNEGVFVFDFSPPTPRPRATLAHALRSRTASVHILTQPDLVAAWSSQVKRWPPAIRTRLQVTTVPRWVSFGIGLLTTAGDDAHLACLHRLIKLTNRCLRCLPALRLQIVATQEQSPKPAAVE